MLNRLMKQLVDLVYGVNKVKNKFLLEHPDEQVLATDGAKGIATGNNEDITRGLPWVASQRAVILLSNKRIVCGKWMIPLDQIEEAQLLQISSLLESGQVLKIGLKDGRHFQFGMQVNPEWTRQEALPLILEEGQLKYSAFSIGIRLFVLGYFLYWMYERFLR